MTYVTKEYYVNTFKGKTISEDEFERLAARASDVIDALVTVPIDDTVDTDLLAKATAYQLEYIKAQGGIEAVTGYADSQMAVSEKLDEYSIQEERTDKAVQNQPSIGGIPISPLTISILRRMGLMSRWAFAGRRCPYGEQAGMPSYHHPV